jgi:hypothetical protein
MGEFNTKLPCREQPDVRATKPLSNAKPGAQNHATLGYQPLFAPPNGISWEHRDVFPRRFADRT